MSCGYGTPGFQCDQIYTVDDVTLARATEWYNLGKKLGLTEFNPTSVNWDAPVPWKGAGSQILTSGEGYGMLIGFGIGLTLLTLFFSIMESKFFNVAVTSEQFNTAGRSVKAGLTASVIVSQWTWAATLLQSSNVAWQYGITGPFWYAAGATIQILLFGILAIEVKRRAPNAHTFLEIIKVRWGKTAHFTFLFFGLAANLIVSAMLLLGGCGVYNAAAGMPIAATSFIIPLLTLVYTLVGGLKATFLAGYVHTTVIMIILVIFVSYVYGVENEACQLDTTKSCTSLGSASLMWERLTFVTALPTRFGDAVVNGVTLKGFHQGPANLGGTMNLQGSYLTIKSMDGLSFGIINIIGNFGTVFVDQSYWQSAIAATPGAAHKGYLLGGMVWFTIPFALATALGLAGTALNMAIESSDAGAGLVPPASAIGLLGPGGGVLVMVQLTMAILSTGSAECIAVSSLISYDVYRGYINPNATGKQILMVSRGGVVFWSLIMAIASIVLNAMGIGLGWVYNFMAIALGSAVCPIACAVYTDKLGPKFAIAAAWIGMICAVIVWFIGAAGYGGISVATLGQLYAQLFGGLTALLASLLVCIIGCFVAPMNFDWTIMYEGILVVDAGTKVVADDDPDATPEALEKAKAWIFKYGWGYSFFLCFLWPLAAIPFGNFGKSTFQLWAAVALMWGWCASTVIVLYPMYESFTMISSIFTGVKAPTPASKGVDTATA